MAINKHQYLTEKELAVLLNPFEYLIAISKEVKK